MDDVLHVLPTIGGLILFGMLVAGIILRGTMRKETSKMVLKRIPLDDHPDLVKLIEDTYNGGRVSEAYVHKITLDGNDVNVEIDLNINDTCGIHGTVQMGLDDDNTVAAKLREIISLEDGND